MRVIHDDPGAGCGCLALTMWLGVVLGFIAFWAFVYYAAVHYILKFW